MPQKLHHLADTYMHKHIFLNKATLQLLLVYMCAVTLHIFKKI